MNEFEHFPNAPITEALVDIQVVLPEDVGMDELELFSSATEGEYPIRQIRTAWTGQVKFGKDVEPEIAGAAPTRDGYLFRTEDGTEVVQARLDGFTFSRLKPYTDWADMRSKSMRLWDAYEKVARPLQIKRIAVRYINQIQVQMGLDIREYVSTTFDIAQDLPQAFNNFLLRIQIPFPDPAASVIITQTTGEQSEDESVPLIFDIDVFRVGTPEIDRASLWDQLDQLREVKNQVFFRSVTEKAKEAFR